jgi:hypothetical protein
LSKDEVVELLKEIQKECPFLSGDAIVLMDPNSGSVLSKSYQLLMRANINADTITCLILVLKRHEYSMNIEPVNDLLVIYKPELSPLEKH